MSLQNIDPIFFALPIVVLSFSFGLVIYWHHKRSLSKWVLGYSALAYFAAIALKYIVQIPTLHIIESTTPNPVLLGSNYGIQTADFEVGGAFLVASIAISRHHLSAEDSEGNGLSLALWENGVFLAIPLLLNYLVYYVTLSDPNSSLAQTLYPLLVKAEPSLFYSTTQALPVIGYGILERITSLIGHFSWGYLAVLSATSGRRRYLAVAMPIGFIIDFMVPFQHQLGTGLFEMLIFVVSIVGLLAALRVARSAHAQGVPRTE